MKGRPGILKIKPYGDNLGQIKRGLVRSPLFIK
jgi:hypothetical protein